jgi:hypothetical protein
VDSSLAMDSERCQTLFGQRFGDRLGGLLINIGRNHACAGLGEFLRIDFADPFAAAGDNDGSAFQIETFVTRHTRAWTATDFNPLPPFRRAGRGWS